MCADLLSGMLAVMDLSAPLSAYDLGSTSSVRPIAGGLINLSFVVDAPRGRFVLQRLHPIFRAELHEDIEAITAHLETRGFTTPRLLRTIAGGLCATEADGVWRMLTFIEGETVHRVESPQRAEAAGQLVGRFHAALADLHHDFQFRRSGVHDTAQHFALLDAAIDAHLTHSRRDVIARLRDELRTGLSELPLIAEAHLPLRIAHGDLKISNLLFDAAGRGVCLVDLDTLSEMVLPYELGDAWRSWCNPLGEDDEAARFDPTLFAAAWRGYRGEMGAVLTTEERELLIPGILTISLELSARFARDVLEDKYFGWDRERFSCRSDHNLVRARGQASLYRSVRAQLGSLRLD